MAGLRIFCLYQTLHNNNDYNNDDDYSDDNYIDYSNDYYNNDNCSNDSNNDYNNDDNDVLFESYYLAKNMKAAVAPLGTVTTKVTQPRMQRIKVSCFVSEE